MDTIKRFVECLIPVTACNLKCNYCYVIQRNNRKNKMATMKYSPEQIGYALNKERWGGICYFSICGAGETTLQTAIEDIVYNILKQGHYVNITTNGTIRKRLEAIINACGNLVCHLHFSFSFHYIELKNKGLIETFFDNILYVKKAGASFLVQINLCDEYVPYLDTIEKICVEKVGAKPQVAVTRQEDKKLEKIKLLTNYSKDKYCQFGSRFNSPLFDFTMKNFNVKRKEFCYAGDWSCVLDLSTGIMRRCYSSYIYQNILKKPDKKIRFLAMGKACSSPFCMNSSHFMAWGVIPEIKCPSYKELRDRKEACWFNKEMSEFASHCLNENNEQYSAFKKNLSNLIGFFDILIKKSYRFYKEAGDRSE